MSPWNLEEGAPILCAAGDIRMPWGKKKGKINALGREEAKLLNLKTVPMHLNRPPHTHTHPPRPAPHEEQRDIISVRR